MSELLKLSFAVARSGWQATYNSTFRFSRMKSGVILLALQLLFFFFLARRAPQIASGYTREGLGGLLALMSLQMAWFGMMYGFSRGQQQLYQGILVPLFQMSPARPLGFLLGRVFESIPIRIWSCFLWAWVYSSTITGPERWMALLLLATLGLAVALIAHLSGLLLLTFWGRYSPDTMRNGNMIFGVLTLGLVTWAMIFLSQGGTVTELALLMRDYRLTVFAAVVGLTGIPGLALLGGLAVRPNAVEDLYRKGVYQVIELGESDVDRPGRSRWLPLSDNVRRAVLSREWLELTRSRMVRIQLMVWLAGTVGVFFAGRAMIGQPLPRVIQFVGFYALFAWFMSYGHWVVRAFEKERRTIHLYRIAAVSGSRLMVAKFISIFVPSAVLVGISTLVGVVAAQLDLNAAVGVMLWTLFGLAAGVFGGFGMTIATADQNTEDGQGGPSQEGAQAQPGGGGAWWALARTIALMICAALPVWAGAGQPGLPWFMPWGPLLLLILLLPLVLLLGGYAIMRRSWEHNG
jgi:hypothetical protein